MLGERNLERGIVKMTERINVYEARELSDKNRRLEHIVNLAFRLVQIRAEEGLYQLTYFFEESDYSHVKNFKEIFKDKGYVIDIVYSTYFFGRIVDNSKPTKAIIRWHG